MKRISRKLMALLIISLLALNLMPAQAMAANVSSTELTKAIQKVKQNFVIPAGCTEFTSSYNDADHRQVLSLNWNTPPGSSQSSEFNAQIDMATGEIIGMHQWKSIPPGQTSQIPRLSINNANDLGYKMLARLVPTRVKSLRPLVNNQIISLSSYSSASCSLRWQRYVGNVPVAGDIASMDIDLVTGQVTSFNLNWTALDFPKNTGAVTPEQALKAFKEAGMLELSYQVPNYYGPMTTDEKDKTPYLVYQVNHPSLGMIDALTGKPLILEPGHYLSEIGSYGGYGGMGKDAAAQSSYNLTPQEQTEVDSAAKLITQAEAEAVVKKVAMSQFNDDFTLRYITLEKDWRTPSQKIWSLNWSAKARITGEMGPSLWARVNAVTGELVSFNYDPMLGANGGEAKLSREQAQRLAEDFIKQAAPSRLNEVRLSPPNAQNRYYPVNSFNFGYQRMVGDVVCPGNGIDMNVDAITSKITSFNLNWNDVKFPSSAQVMGNDKAYGIFAQLAPLTLTYVAEWGPQGLNAMHLVYRPKGHESYPDVVVIDANSGIRLDTQGKPLVLPPQAFTFNDIKGAYGEKEISILGQAGLMGEYKTAFKPGETVKLVTLLRAMQGCRNGVYSINDQTDENIMKQAREMGLLKENLAANTIVTRELFCRLLTRYLGVEYLAQLPSIYKVTWRDVPASLNGYTTIATGLTLLEVKGNKFEPAKPITRSQAAVALVRSLPRLNSR